MQSISRLALLLNTVLTSSRVDSNNALMPYTGLTAVLGLCLARYPVLRIVGMSCVLACFIVAACLTGYPYRLTPLGGFIAGLFPGEPLTICLIKNAKHSMRCEYWQTGPS